MKLLGFNFNKISIERFSNKAENLKINTDVNISELNKVERGAIKTKEELIGVKFTYNIDYSPDFAKIELTGNILVSVDPKIAKEVLNKWKGKKLPEEFNISLFNLILRKSNIKALQLEDEMNLPLHMPLQTLKKE